MRKLETYNFVIKIHCHFLFTEKKFPWGVGNWILNCYSRCITISADWKTCQSSCKSCELASGPNRNNLYASDIYFNTCFQCVWVSSSGITSKFTSQSKFSKHFCCGEQHFNNKTAGMRVHLFKISAPFYFVKKENIIAIALLFAYYSSQKRKNHETKFNI